MFEHSPGITKVSGGFHQHSNVVIRNKNNVDIGTSGFVLHRGCEASPHSGHAGLGLYAAVSPPMQAVVSQFTAAKKSTELRGR